MDVVSKNWIRQQNIKRNSPNLLITFLLSTPLLEKNVCVCSFTDDQGKPY